MMVNTASFQRLFCAILLMNSKLMISAAFHLSSFFI